MVRFNAEDCLVRPSTDEEVEIECGPTDENGLARQLSIEARLNDLTIEEILECMECNEKFLHEIGPDEAKEYFGFVDGSSL